MYYIYVFKNERGDLAPFIDKEKGGYIWGTDLIELQNQVKKLSLEGYYVPLAASDVPFLNDALKHQQSVVFKTSNGQQKPVVEQSLKQIKVTERELVNRIKLTSNLIELVEKEVSELNKILSVFDEDDGAKKWLSDEVQGVLHSNVEDCEIELFIKKLKERQCNFREVLSGRFCWAQAPVISIDHTGDITLSFIGKEGCLKATARALNPYQPLIQMKYATDNTNFNIADALICKGQELEARWYPSPYDGHGMLKRFDFEKVLRDLKS